MSGRRLARRRRFAWPLALLALSLVLLTPGTASAAVAVPGSVSHRAYTNAPFLTCSGTGLVTAALTVEDRDAGKWTWYLRTTLVNPAAGVANGSSPVWPSTTSVPVQWASTAVTPTGTSLVFPSQKISGSVRYLTVTLLYNSQLYLGGTWDLGAVYAGSALCPAEPALTSPAPTTSAAPTTSVAPTTSAAPTTSGDPTTSAAPSTSAGPTSAPPTTSAPSTSAPTPTPGTGGSTPGTGSALSCPADSPCVVTLASGSALSDDQWVTISTALSLVTFFVTAGFFTTMRRRGR